MSNLTIGFALFIAPILSVVILAYLIGRADGRRREQERTQLPRAFGARRSPNIVRE